LARDEYALFAATEPGRVRGRPDRQTNPDLLQHRDELRAIRPGHCGRLGIDVEETDPEAFAECWATRIGEFLARGMLEWLWREDCFAP
jgi:hypothetical protein